MNILRNICINRAWPEPSSYINRAAEEATPAAVAPTCRLLSMAWIARDNYLHNTRTYHTSRMYQVYPILRTYTPRARYSSVIVIAQDLKKIRPCYTRSVLSTLQ